MTTLSHYGSLIRCGTSDKLCHTRPWARLIAKRKRRRFGEPYAEYHCRDCGFWHVGHSNGLRRLLPVRR